MVIRDFSPSSYLAGDGNNYPIRYVKSEDAFSVEALGSVEELEPDLSGLLESDDVDGLLSKLGVNYVLTAFNRLFATVIETYQMPDGGDGITEGNLTHFLFSEELRKVALDFYTRLPGELADTVVDAILNLPHEDYPKHRVGYSHGVKRAIMVELEKKGSIKAWNYLEA